MRGVLNLAFVLSLVGCDTAGRGPRRDAAIDAPPDAPDAEVFVPPDPTVDAGPPPSMACEPDAGAACELPPSTCLDASYLVYYTGGTCSPSGSCVYETNLMFCPSGCVNGGCQGGFT